MSIKKSILARIQVIYLIVVAVAVLIGMQILNIQLLQGSYWHEKAEANSLQYKIKKATRGNIYADGDILLATSVPLYKLSIDPYIIDEEIYKKDIGNLSKVLADFFKDKTPTEYLRKINDARQARKRYLILTSKLLTLSDKKLVSQFPIFKEGAAKGGILFEKVEERTLPFEGLASRTIGFLNENNEGVGLEASFNKQLAGKDGKALYQKIVGGEWKPISSGSRIQPVHGLDIYTSVDINIQDIAHKALQNALVQHQANYGCAIVMEVKTGEIKAMVNLGKVSEGKYAENYNYAIADQGSTDPGSTFKTASMLALLEDTTLNLTDTIETGGGTYRYYDRVMTDTRAGGWGSLSVQQAFEFSSNIGVSKLLSNHFGRKEQAYIDYLRKFGLANPLNSLKMVGVAKSYIKDTKDNTWSGVTLPWMSIGYESKISPLQLLTFYNAIANQGYIVEPKIIRKITKNDQLIEEYKTITQNKPIAKPENIQKITQLLEGVVERGTAKNIQSKQYRIAGKTGTSQKLNLRGRYIKKYRTSFAGFFPADKPKYSCIVVIDEPQGGEQYGGDVSAPVFKIISDKLYTQDADIQSKELKRETALFQTNLPNNQVSYVQDIKQVCDVLGIPNMSAKNHELVLPEAGKYQVSWKDLSTKPNTVPNTKGMSLRDALYLLENKGLKVSYSGVGRVKTQSLMPGALLKKGDKITLQLGK